MATQFKWGRKLQYTVQSGDAVQSGDCSTQFKVGTQTVLTSMSVYCHICTQHNTPDKSKCSMQCRTVPDTPFLSRRTPDALGALNSVQSTFSLDKPPAVEQAKTLAQVVTQSLEILAENNAADVGTNIIAPAVRNQGLNLHCMACMSDRAGLGHIVFWPSARYKAYALQILHTFCHARCSIPWRQLEGVEIAQMLCHEEMAMNHARRLFVKGSAAQAYHYRHFFLAVAMTVVMSLFVAQSLSVMRCEHTGVCLCLIIPDFLSAPMHAEHTPWLRTKRVMDALVSASELDASLIDVRWGASGVYTQG
eukprot:1159858-Pelagomonas_calceolata.AAC.10